jgi:pyruvate kinase
MIHSKRTKIVATVGPACSDPKVLLAMINSGVNVFRINFSHGTYEDHGKIIDAIHNINKENQRTIAILADLQGPKIRVGKIKNNAANLEPGATFTITTNETLGNDNIASITYQDLPRDVSVGERILLDDGKIELVVKDTNDNDTINTEVVYGGILSSNKGVNLPNTRISQPSLTVKDEKDLKYALSKEVHWIALSFVRSATDVYELKKKIKKTGSLAKVISKIEKPEAIKDIDNIIEESDAIMVARGDLGVEVPMEELPTLQKDIVAKCVRAARPVIIATQMMENMISNARPTRAEVSDVATAVSEGSDAVMLSGETSVGKYPVKVIETMTKIINEVELDESNYMHADGYNKWNNGPNPESPAFLAGAICFNAVKISDSVDARAVIGITQAGYTAHKLSSFRPKSKVFIFSGNKFLIHQLSLVWGVTSLFYDRDVTTSETFADMHHVLKTRNHVKSGDVLINTASMPFIAKARTNMLKISIVE